MKQHFLSFITVFYFLLMISCQTRRETRKEVYNNDFESANLTNIENGKTALFNQTKVLGNYNTEGFELKLKDLPAHDLVEITFDLYIHDSWDGNKLSGGIDGPDIWKMFVDNTLYINTTFSNTICPSGFCPPQAYPNNYPNNNNNPKNGAFNKDLPGLCNLSGVVGGSTLYKIKKTVPHRQVSLELKCLDELVQPNANEPICDESWSIDNLKLMLVTLD